MQRLPNPHIESDQLKSLKEIDPTPSAKPNEGNDAQGDCQWNPL